MTIIIDWSKGIPDTLSCQKVVDEATYASYRFNRERSPSISPEKWKCIFPNADVLEERLVNETSRS